MQKVLITGANGFLGYYLVEQLLNKNYNVVATGKGPSRLPFSKSNFQYETLDFVDDEKVKKVFETHVPQIVIHTGAISKPDECELNKEAAFRTNVTGTMTLLNYSKQYNSFFIFLSTDFVFDGETGFYKEEDKPNPVNYYGQTKLLAEDEVKKYERDWTIVRTVLVYGKPFSGRDNIISNVAKSLRSGKRLQMVDDQVRTPTFVEDLALAIVLIIEKNAKGVFHISGDDVLTPYQMAIKTAKFLKFDTALISNVSSNTFQQPAKRPLKTGFNISKAINELGFHPISFKEGLMRSLSS